MGYSSVNAHPTGVDEARAQKMRAELAALKAHPQGQLDRATALELSPEIHKWAVERHRAYSKNIESSGYTRSYHPDLKTPENVLAKKLDQGMNELSDAPRTISERRHWNDIHGTGGYPVARRRRETDQCR